MPPKSRTSRKPAFSPDTNLRRRDAGTRAERRSFLLACEGKTERLYFSGFKTRSGPVIQFRQAERHVDGMLEQLDELSQEAEIHDQVWLVVDADGRELEALAVKAVGGDVRLGISRPCFELWLLLHHIEYSTPQWECRPLKQKLKSVLPGWSEGSTRFDDFADGLGEACRRAQQLESTGQDLNCNPSTSVWCLIEAIRAASNAQPGSKR